MTINFNGVKVISTGGGGGGASWPGDGSKLLSGDGAQVTAGSGLTFSAGQISAESLAWPGVGSGMTAADGSLVTVGNGLSLSAGGLSASGIRKSYIPTVGDSTVSLLLHMDGANNSTTFTDRSYSPKTVTAYGNAKISTAQSKFGGASAAFDGSGDYLLLDNTADLTFGSGAFTIEGWVYLNSVGYQTIFSKHTPSVAADIGLSINNSTSVILGLNNTPGGFVRTVPTISANTWYHFAIVGGGSGVVKIYWNGTQAGANIAAASVNNNVQKWIIGADQWSSPAYFLNGYLDEFRITKGVARYTSDFTPSATAFANADGTAELSATNVGDTVYSSDGIYICTSLSPLTWKKLSVSSTITF